MTAWWITQYKLYEKDVMNVFSKMAALLLVSEIWLHPSSLQFETFSSVVWCYRLFPSAPSRSGPALSCDSRLCGRQGTRWRTGTWFPLPECPGWLLGSETSAHAKCSPTCKLFHSSATCSYNINVVGKHTNTYIMQRITLTTEHHAWPLLWTTWFTRVLTSEWDSILWETSVDVHKHVFGVFLSVSLHPLFQSTHAPKP